MRFWVGVTDNAWFEFLSEESAIDEVNFWHPSGRRPFATLPEGTPFLFKLKRPHNHIAGGAFFVNYESLPLPLAWDAFDRKNGAASYRDLARMIGPLRSRDEGTTPEIGCSILAHPFFWPRDDWIPVEGLFSGNVVVGKTYDSRDGEAGALIWTKVQARLEKQAVLQKLVAEPEVTGEYGSALLVRPRRGQGTFRATVTNAYKRTCAITGEHTLPALEAAHIRPFGEDTPNNTYNGLLLRADFHKLFDVGLVTVTPEYRIEVSPRIREQWYNGKAYYRLNGQQLAIVPDNERDRPRPDLLTWHNENVFERVPDGSQ